MASARSSVWRTRSAVAAFGAIEEVVGQSLLEQDDDAVPGIDLDDDDYEGGNEGTDFRRAERDEDGIPALRRWPDSQAPPGPRPLDVARLKGVLQDLIACRQLLDSALKDG